MRGREEERHGAKKRSQLWQQESKRVMVGVNQKNHTAGTLVGRFV